MKKPIVVVVAIVLALAMLVSAVSVALGPTMVSADKPPGKLAYNLNIIGRGNYGGGEVNAKDYTGGGANNENRHTIFIPLKTTYYTDPCLTTGGQNNPDTSLVPEKGVKMSIVAGDSFAVLDGDATDNNGATLQMPAGTATYDVYVVAKGKPGGCLDLEAYTYLDEVLIFIGSIDVDRGTAKPNKINISNLLYSNGVQLFADPYEGYFWQLYNNGLRLMNVRFYEQ